MKSYTGSPLINSKPHSSHPTLAVVSVVALTLMSGLRVYIGFSSQEAVVVIQV